jgi:hypothetical protein
MVGNDEPRSDRAVTPRLSDRTYGVGNATTTAGSTVTGRNTVLPA